VIGSSLIAQKFTATNTSGPGRRRPTTTRRRPRVELGGEQPEAPRPGVAQRSGRCPVQGGQSVGPGPARSCAPRSRTSRHGSRQAGPGRGLGRRVHGGCAAKQGDFTRDKAALHANVFDMWLQDPANRAKAADLEPGPADSVTASAAASTATSPCGTPCPSTSSTGWREADPTGRRRRDGAAGIAALARKQSFTPLAGLVGEPLVQRAGAELELDRHFPLATPTATAP